MPTFSSLPARSFSSMDFWSLSSRNSRPRSHVLVFLLPPQTASRPPENLLLTWVHNYPGTRNEGTSQEFRPVYHEPHLLHSILGPLKLGSAWFLVSVELRLSFPWHPPCLPRSTTAIDDVTLFLITADMMVPLWTGLLGAGTSDHR